MPQEIPAGSGRRLAALHHPPTAQRKKDRAVLIINPLGQEAVRAHRLLRVLADRLARNGIDVLRFDLHGCGDSSGDDLDGDMVGWQDDVLAAHRWLLENTGADAVGWLGIRLGFAIGWQAAARFGARAPDDVDSATGNGQRRLSASEVCRRMLTEVTPPDRLVGWDPVVVGQGYLDALWHDHKEALSRAFSLPTVPDRQLRRQREEDGLSEAMGFALSPRLQQQIRALDQQDWRTLPVPQVAVLQSNAALSWHTSRRSPALLLEAVDIDFDWTSEEALNTPLVPDQALRKLIPWLTEASLPSVAGTPVPAAVPQQAALEQAASEQATSEQAASEQAASARPASGQPTSGQPAPERPGSGQPASAQKTGAGAPAAAGRARTVQAETGSASGASLAEDEIPVLDSVVDGKRESNQETANG